MNAWQQKICSQLFEKSFFITLSKLENICICGVFFFFFNEGTPVVFYPMGLIPQETRARTHVIRAKQGWKIEHNTLRSKPKSCTNDPSLWWAFVVGVPHKYSQSIEHFLSNFIVENDSSKPTAWVKKQSGYSWGFRLLTKEILWLAVDKEVIVQLIPWLEREGKDSLAKAVDKKKFFRTHWSFISSSAAASVSVGIDTFVACSSIFSSFCFTPLC